MDSNFKNKESDFFVDILPKISEVDTLYQELICMISHVRAHSWMEQAVKCLNVNFANRLRAFRISKNSLLLVKAQELQVKSTKLLNQANKHSKKVKSELECLNKKLELLLSTKSKVVFTLREYKTILDEKSLALSNKVAELPEGSQEIIPYVVNYQNAYSKYESIVAEMRDAKAKVPVIVSEYDKLFYDKNKVRIIEKKCKCMVDLINILQYSLTTLLAPVKDKIKGSDLIFSLLPNRNDVKKPLSQLVTENDTISQVLSLDFCQYYQK